MIKTEAVPEFYYLGDMLSAGSGCELAAVTHCESAWGNLSELLPLLTNRNLSILTRGQVCSTCMRSVMLHLSETWSMNNSKVNNKVSSDSLLSKLGLKG